MQWKQSRDVFPGKIVCHEILNEPNYKLQGLQHRRAGEKEQALKQVCIKAPEPLWSV